MNTAKLVISAAFALLALPATNAHAFVECFLPPRGEPPAPAAQPLVCSSNVTGHVGVSTVNEDDNILIVTLSEGEGNARADSAGYDANGDVTATAALNEPGQNEDEGRDTIVAHDIQLITDE